MSPRWILRLVESGHIQKAHGILHFLPRTFFLHYRFQVPPLRSKQVLNPEISWLRSLCFSLPVEVPRCHQFNLWVISWLRILLCLCCHGFSLQSNALLKFCDYLLIHFHTFATALPFLFHTGIDISNLRTFSGSPVAFAVKPKLCGTYPRPFTTYFCSAALIFKRCWESGNFFLMRS